MSQLLARDLRRNAGVKLTPHVVSEYHSPQWFITTQDLDFDYTVPNKGDYVTYFDTETGSMMLIMNAPLNTAFNLKIQGKDFPKWGAVNMSFGCTRITNDSISANYYSPDEGPLTIAGHSGTRGVAIAVNHFTICRYDRTTDFLNYYGNVQSLGNFEPGDRCSFAIWVWFQSPDVMATDINALNKSVQSLVAESLVIEDRLNKMDELAQAMEREIQSKVAKTYLKVQTLKVLTAKKKGVEKRRKSRRIENNLLKMFDTDEEITKATKVLKLL